MAINEAELGPKVKAFRASRQMTVERLSTESGVPLHILEKVERGEVIREGGAYLLALSRVIGLVRDDPAKTVTKRGRKAGWQPPPPTVLSPQEKSLRVGQSLMSEVQKLAHERATDPKHQLAEVIVAALISEKLDYESNLKRFEGPAVIEKAEQYSLDLAFSVMVSAVMVARENALACGDVAGLLDKIEMLRGYVNTGEIKPSESGGTVGEIDAPSAGSDDGK